MKAKVEREYEAFNLRRKERALMDDDQRELTEIRQLEQHLTSYLKNNQKE